MSALVTVDFRGDTLFAVERDDGVFVAVKPISDRLGLDWSSQHKRLKRDPILREGVVISTIPSPGGPQQMVGLALRLINGWLFGISVNHVKPELREHVLAYQRECYETLADRFLGRRVGTQPQADREQNQDTEYRRRLDTVSEARRLYGSARAQLLYEKLGLPEVPELPDPPPAEIPAALAGDPLVTAIITLLEASPSGVWQGTPTAFLKALSAPGIAPEHARASPHWPAFPKTLSVAIKRITPALNALGVEIVRRHSQVTTWTLRLLREPATSTATGAAPEGKAFH